MPVGVVEAIEPHSATFVRRMHEAAFADVDADMTDAARLVVEKDEVT